MTKIIFPFGIDLGTTQSAAAVFAPDQAEPSVAADGDRLTLPSVLRSAGQNRWQVGFDALEASSEAPLIQSVKRHMGEDRPVRHTDDLLPEDASAVILSAVTERMRTHLAQNHPDLDCSPQEAVITVPAYFDAPQIEATRRAGELAGLRVAGLVQEPTAAAIYHTWKNDLGDGTYLVYDLGGGTFDVSIIRSIYGEYQVLAIDGDNHLGGDDFDRRLAGHFLNFLVDSGFDLAEKVETEADAGRFDVLMAIARQTKEDLSDSSKVSVKERAIFDDRGGKSVDLELSVSRDDFESLIDDLLEGTILACRNALLAAKRRHRLTPQELDGIFLVGGSTRVPAVRRRLVETIGKDCSIDDDSIWSDQPETSVARGAALHAAAICPLRFESDEGFSIAITDLPPLPGDDRLIGELQWEKGDPPTAIRLGGEHEEIIQFQSRDDTLRFSWPFFDSAALAPEGSPAVSTTLWRGDEEVAGASLWLPHRPEGARQAPTLALTNPAVLAKDINIEVVEDDRPTHHRLIEKGTHLPTTVRHRLVTGDRSGSLVLRLFQHRLPIHTLVMKLPDDTAPGTPVELTVDVDQAMNLTASGTVEDQTFHVRIDRPATPRRWRWEEIEELIDQVDGVSARLWGGEARRFEAISRNILAGIRAAVRHDRHRLQVLARRLESLLAEYAPRPRCTPGRERIDALLDTIRRVVFSADDDRLGRSHDEWRRQLDELSRQVDKAWRGDDDHRWQDVADRVQATYESVGQDEFFFRRRDPDVYANTLYDAVTNRFQSIRSQAQGFPFAADVDARKLQKDEVDRIVAEVERLADDLPGRQPTADDVGKLERLARSLDHLEKRLERVHTLGVPRRGDSP